MPSSETSKTESNLNIDEDIPKSNTETEESKLPNGGWAWIVVFGSFMCNVILGN